MGSWPAANWTAFPTSVAHWSLKTRREWLINIGAKVVRSARNVVFQRVEAALPRHLLRTILDRTSRLRLSKALSG